MTRMEKIQLVRSEQRITGRQLVDQLFTDFTPLAGDRLYGEDTAIYGGIGMLLGMPVTVISHDKGEDFEGRIANNFGMAHPEGYRKAMRLAKSAEKFKRPIVTIVDTAGAYPGIEAEERGQASAIASSLQMFSSLKVPVVTIILSEGGSGGALAIAHSDYIFCFEHSYYSVISPEGYAQILYKSQKTVEEIIDDLPIFAEDLLAMKIVDQIIAEPEEGITSPLESVTKFEIQQQLKEVIDHLRKKDRKQLVLNRHHRFRKF